MFDVISSTDKVPNSTSEFFIYCSLACILTLPQKPLEQNLQSISPDFTPRIHHLLKNSQ